MNIIRCGIAWRLSFENSMMLFHSKCNAIIALPQQGNAIEPQASAFDANALFLSLSLCHLSIQKSSAVWMFNGFQVRGVNQFASEMVYRWTHWQTEKHTVVTKLSVAANKWNDFHTCVHHVSFLHLSRSIHPANQVQLTNGTALISILTFHFWNRLYTRDPHQLFELLCIQLRCISIAYSDGLKQMLKTNGEDESPTYNPVELLTCKFKCQLKTIANRAHIPHQFPYFIISVCFSHLGWLW